jgi:hypothetical protein
LDNAIAESFISALKAELVSNLTYPARRAAKSAIFRYLWAFYNTRWPRSSLGYWSPAEFEEDRIGEASVAQNKRVHSSRRIPVKHFVRSRLPVARLSVRQRPFVPRSSAPPRCVPCLFLLALPL